MVDQVVDTDQVEVSANDNSSPAPDESAPLPKPDDDQIAQYIAALWLAVVAFLRGRWYWYKHGYWHELDRAEVAQKVREILRQFRIRRIEVSARRIESVMKLLEYDQNVPNRVLIEAERLQIQYINFRNSLYSLKLHQAEEHRRDLYFTYQLDYDYDPDADCPHFRQFLKTSLTKDASGKEPDWEMINHFQEQMAYALTGHTGLQSSVWLVGPAASGKSTAIKLMLSLAGPMGGALDLNQLGQNRYQLATLEGKRVVTCTESDTAVLPDGIFKALTGGGDPIQVEEKYKQPYTFVPMAKMWWAMNDAPRTKDRSGALMRRLYPIVFTRTIPLEERIADLDMKLEQERAGIFAWAMVGLERLQRRGKFVMPERSRLWLAEYALRNDYPRLFQREVMEAAPDNWILSTELYDRYADWCMRQGVSKMSQPAMKAEWQRIGFQFREIATGSQYGGWRFKA